MTFATLEHDVTRITGFQGRDVVSLLQEAENVFIEKTLCTEAYAEIDMDDEGLGPIWDLAANFVKEIRVEYDGVLLTKANPKLEITIYNTGTSYRTGYPEGYRIIPGGTNGFQIQLIPKPVAAKKIGYRYSYYQTASAASPIIPAKEHRKLSNYAIGKSFEMDQKFDLSELYLGKFERDCNLSYREYKMMRFRQKRIYDVNGGEEGGGRNIQSLMNVVTE